MLEKTFGLFFFLKQSKTKKNDCRYVYLRITVNGEARELSIKRRWPTTRWNQSLGKAVGTNEDAKNLNTYIETLSAKIYQAKLNLLETERKITAQSLKNYIIGCGEDQTLLQLIGIRQKRIQALIGKGYSLATLKRYKTICNHIRDFIKWRYEVTDINIRDLNYEFISDFAFWLRSYKDCGNNSVAKYVGNLKGIITDAVRKSWLKNNPFIEFKATKDDVIRTALTKEELHAIISKEFTIERLDIVKDIFVFCCYTGLAYVDVNSLKQEHITTGIDGSPWITIRRQKTGTSSKLPLLPIPLAILEKYKDHARCITQNNVLPVLTNQKMNAYLKEIADVCGIKKNLTFHLARHTFATTVTLNNGVPIETVSKMLGHKSLAQTQHYAKILDGKISSDMQVLRDNLKL
ncbi:site-specific integrase [Pedobacter sp. Du54]|uniref:site-specific integrase n=1 Tax=Pedobacter anseongensis TaxID=3133439 RepID=UPI0030A72D6D